MRASLIYGQLTASCLSTALVLDSSSCRQAPFASPDGKENYLNNAFETVFDVYEGIAQEFQNPTRQLFSSYFELLFPAAKAENVKDQTGVAIANLLRRRNIKFENINSAPAGSLDINEIYVFCSLDRFKYNSRTKAFDTLLNGESFSMPEKDFTECEAGHGSGGAKAFTTGRRDEAEKKRPNRPDTIQFCPRWFDEAAKISWANSDESFYSQIYSMQNRNIPDYPWPQRGYVPQHRQYSNKQTGPRNLEQHVSQDHVTNSLTFIIAHELTHTGNWYAPAPKTPLTSGALPGIKGTYDVGPEPYRWDYVVKEKHTTNAQNFAYLWQGWYALTIHGFAIDFMGEWLPARLVPTSKDGTTTYSGRKSGMPWKSSSGAKPGAASQARPGGPSRQQDTEISAGSHSQAGAKSGSRRPAARPNTGSRGGTSDDGQERNKKGCCGIM